MVDFSQILEFMRSLSPAMMIVLGAVLFLFSGAIKWLARVGGAFMILWGIATLLGDSSSPPIVNIENKAENMIGGIACQMS